MPEADDTRSLVPLASADISADDLIQVYHAATNTVRKSPAPSGATTVALLADQDLEVASIGLTDGTGTEPAAGRLVLNANNDPVVGDGEFNTEDRPYLVNSLESLNFSTRVLAAVMDNALFSRKVKDISLPASALTDGKQLFITGSTFAIWSAGNKPDIGAYLAICKEGQDPLTEGHSLNFAEGVTTEDRSFTLPLFFSVAASTWTLARQSSIAGCLVRKNNAGTVTHAAAWDNSDYAINTAITGAAGEPVKLELYIVTGDSSDAVTANLFASGQLSVIHE